MTGERQKPINAAMIFTAPQVSARLTLPVQTVDATLKANPTYIENKGGNRSLGLDQPEHRPG